MKAIDPANAPGNARTWNAAVEYQSIIWDIDAKEYKSIAREVWAPLQDILMDREGAKRFARHSLGLNAGDIRKLENLGFDYSSDHPKIKHLDELGRELAFMFGGLAWCPDSDNLDSLTWELIKTGVEKMPAKHTAEYHAPIESYLRSLT